MTSDDKRRLSAIRARAKAIADQTQLALKSNLGTWVTDETDAAADIKAALSPDVAFGWAHRRARTAIRLCDEGDIEVAHAFLAEAKEHYARGLEASVDPRKLKARLQPQKRGAGDKSERDLALYQAASRLIAVDNDLTIAKACQAALTSNAALATEFGGGMADRTLERAFARGKAQRQ